VSRVVLVTSLWGDSHGEGGTVVRLVAGALAVRAQVEVVALVAGAGPGPGTSPRTHRDSVFVVHEVPHERAQTVPELVASLDPDSVVLAGPEAGWVHGPLRSIGTCRRVVSLPLLGTELDVALPIDRAAADPELFEMTGFGRYVVLLTGYPAGSPGAVRTPGHDYVREAIGPVAVAEVASDRWSVSDRKTQLEMAASPSRPNLWRLLRHAEVCLDLRPQGTLGRETIESLLLGTPVVVPEGTVAAEHAERSNGGLWYRDYRELFDAARAIVDDPSLRARLGRQGREWAGEVHGDQGRFSEQVARLVLG
jgi:glycosyltransferase involved in cell wall biosynthesis